MRQIAGVGQQSQEAVLDVLFGVGGDKGALALAAHQQVVGGEFVDGLAHRALAHAKPRSQIEFAGDHVARFPFARLQAAQDQCLDLLVEGAERGRGRRHAARVAKGRGGGVRPVGGRRFGRECGCGGHDVSGPGGAARLVQSYLI